MTREEYHDNLRALIHDNGDGYSIDDTFHSTEELERIGLECRNKVFEACLESGKYLTINRMLDAFTGTSGANVPPNFYRIEIGRKNDGSFPSGNSPWVLPYDLRIGEAMVGQGLDGVYVRGGKFLGTADQAYCWSVPSSTFQKGFGEFGDFPDAFYNCVMTLEAMELLMKEGADIADRLSALEEYFTEQFATLE